MALKAFLIMMNVAAVVVAPVLATDHIVGDSAGWDLNVDYTAWAKDRDFRVGDSLTFIYIPGSHNVLKVNGADFQRCSSSNSSAYPYVSGFDVITLGSPGNKWYICDFANHCSSGMKLTITVSDAQGPTPSDAGKVVSHLKSCLSMLLVMAACRMIIA